MRPDPSELRESDPRRRLILAADVPTREDALRLLEPLRGELAWVKLGMELFTATGPAFLRELRDLELRIFLDMKFHDIPNTMAGGVRSAAALGAGLCTVHAAAGKGVEAAAEAAAAAHAASPDQAAVGVLAVTVLTSHSEDELPELFASPLQNRELVLRLGRRAVAAGADGLVASPLEVERLREELGWLPLLVIPGIRPAGAARDDQGRVGTPRGALRAGADYLVIGRPISRAPEPREALLRILDEMAAAM